MRYTENEVDGRHENGVDSKNRNREFATWGEIDVAYFWEYLLPVDTDRNICLPLKWIGIPCHSILVSMRFDLL